jgi:glycosyltransferase involved in cell wall biosynthesis
MHSLKVDGQAGPRSVAMVTRQFSNLGGLELYTHKLVEGLLAHQDRVTVVCEKNESTLVHPNLTIVTFPAPSPQLRKSAKIDYYLRVASAKIKDCGPFDIVHSQHFPVHSADVVTFHNHSIFRLSESGFAWEGLLNYFKGAFIPAYASRSHVDRMLMIESTVRLFPSKICRDDFIKHYGQKAGIGDQACLLAYPGFLSDDSDKIAAPQARRFPAQSNFVFLFVGRGFRKKGLDVLLDSFRLLRKGQKRFKLLIAGLSAKRWDKARLKLLGIDQDVEYLGFRKDMVTVYANAHAIVLSSRLEPFGMAVLQAMAQGIVPIVAESCGVAELLTHEKDALIVKNQLKADEFCQAMDRLMSDQTLYEKLSRQTILTARQQDWEKSVAATRQAYDLVLLSKQQSALTKLTR